MAKESNLAHGESGVSLESLKRQILVWIAAFVLIFTPLWWKTTSVYRAMLPFERINAINAQANKSLKFRIEINLKYPKKIKSLEKALNSRLNRDFELLFVNDFKGYDFEIQCIQNLSSVEIFVAKSRSVLISIPDSECSSENAERITGDTILDLFQEITADNEMNTLKFSENYQVTWSLLNGDPRDSIVTWDIENAVQEYFTRLKRAIEPLTGLDFSSQIQNYAELPIKVEKIDNQFVIRQESLPQFINSAEWNLVPVSSVYPPINFVLYIPGKDSRPLNILLSDGSISKINSFLIPQWGGVVLKNVPNSSTQFYFDSKSLEPIMQVFMTQMRILLGVGSIRTPRLSKRKGISIVFEKCPESGITMLELDLLFRERTIQNIKDAASTLVSLSTLIKKLPNMIVHDHIQTRVIESLDHIDNAMAFLANNDLLEAAKSGRQATVAAEAAFFDKSMVSLLYFPSEHLLAIYMPFFLPIALPLFSAYKEQWLRWRYLRKSKSD